MKLTYSRLLCTVVVWGFDKKTVAVLKEMQSRTMSHLSQENSDVAAAEKVF